MALSRGVRSKGFVEDTGSAAYRSSASVFVRSIDYDNAFSMTGTRVALARAGVRRVAAP